MEQKNNILHGVAFGKLYLAGEYAILEDYSKALLTSVPQKIVTTVEPSEKTTIFDTLHNITVDLYEDNKNFTMIQQFILFLNKYTNSEKTYSIKIYNELHSNNKKYGLGSSGAVLVSIAKAILTFEKIPFDNETIFKLVTLYNLTHNISGSMGDVAASLNEGLTFYQKFNTSKLNHIIASKDDIKEIINSPWDGLTIKPIYPKAKITIFARWTGEVVDTKEHVKLWKENKENYSTEYVTFVSTSNKLVEQLVDELESGNESFVLNTINKLRENLHYLESFSNIPMETAAMKNYIASYPAGKQSGSGSGDIVLGFNRSNDNFQLQLNLEQL